MKIIKMIDFSTNKKLILDTDASNLYDFLFQELKKGEDMLLDFAGIEYSVSSFFNASIGLLYKDYKNLSDKVKFENIDEADRFIIEKVTERAKQYYENPQNFIDIDEV